ncbi:hypothetical protein ANTPLA_LOCUS6091 [Anthophora plagiata]
MSKILTLRGSEFNRYRIKGGVTGIIEPMSVAECQKAVQIPVGYGSLSEASDPAVRAAPHLSMAATVSKLTLKHC